MAEQETQEKINQLQNIEQNLQHLLSQRQQFQMQQVEVDSALKELGKTEKAYKIIGNIMVATDKDVLKTDLEEKKKKVELRTSTIEKQEEKLRSKAESIRKDVMEQMQQAEKENKKKD